MKLRLKTYLAVAAVVLAAGQAAAGEVVRHPIPGSDFPIARAVEVPADVTTVYVSGAVPTVIDQNADRGMIAAYGSVEQQTESVLRSIEATLGELKLGLGDVVKMQVFLVPGKDGALDFGGFMSAYKRFFGTASQPQLPARSVVGVAALANPGWLVEIEVTAVRK